MCVGVPMVVEQVNGLSARCLARGCRRDVSLLLLGDEALAPGAHLLVHQGLALRRLDDEEAALIWEAFDLALGAENTARMGDAMIRDRQNHPRRPGARPWALAAIATLTLSLGSLTSALAQSEPQATTSDDAPDRTGIPTSKDRRVGNVHNQIRKQKAREEHARREQAPSPVTEYLAFKKTLEEAGITFQISPGLMIQWGAPKGGKPASQFIVNPNVNWDVFDSPLIGKGSIQFSYSYNDYFTNQNGSIMSNNLNVLSLINDTPSYGYFFNQLTYTHEFPGKWLQITAGQYQIGSFDTNAYAGNQQTNFVNYALSQNASQAYIPTSLGAYVQINPTDTLSFAAGLQDGNNTSGNHIQASTVGKGPSTWFAYGQWTPQFPGMGSAQYSLLYYNQPNIVAQPGVPPQPSGQGWSFNAVQNLNDTWGLFARANTASGSFPTIETSVAGGVIYNNPFGLGASDQIGLGLAWNKTNLAAFPNQSVRSSETVAEAYWNVVISKFLQIGPSLQVVFNPALHPGSDTAGILTLRATGLF